MTTFPHRSRGALALAAALLAPLAALPARAQMHKVTAPETVVRAVGVYEWTGDLSKPVGSRLIPVTLFINGKLEDAGVYMARPIPFALETGNVYQLEDHGLPRGTLELAFARHLTAASNAEGFDDGWFGYGGYKALPAEKAGPQLRRVTPGTVTRSGSDTATAAVKDDGRPHLTRRTGSESDSTAKPTTASSASPDKTTADTKATAGSQNEPEPPSTGATPAGDPDRPTMKRRNNGQADPAATTADGKPTAGTNSTATPAGSAASAAAKTPSPADDPDRPVLKRRPASADGANTASSEIGEEKLGAVASLNADPNRPTMKRGKPTSAMTDTDIPKLQGLPKDLHQQIAVSDAKTREPHDFSRPWASEAERDEIVGKLRELAQDPLLKYIAANGGAVPAPCAAKPKTAAHPAAHPAAKTATAASNSKPAATAKTGAAASCTPAATAKPVSTTKTTTVTSKTGVTTTTTVTTTRMVKGAPESSGVPLTDEVATGYSLSYGAQPTFVYTAHTNGEGAALRYVTMIAQEDVTGAIHPVLTNVTDALHEDRTPWMRPVGVVDAEASNRASVVMELRGMHARQFALYQVLGGNARQTFLSGTTQ